MKAEQKETYVQPALVKHELLRDITATISGGRVSLKYSGGGGD